GKSPLSPLTPVPWEPSGFYYPEEFRPGRLPWHEAGMYYIQEASAMVPARLCGVQPGDRVLDLCAAPGGKSTKLAADLRGRGLLVANEIHPERTKVLSANLERMGVRNALVTNASPQELASRFPLYFDRIVVDAPCSGEGMFRKEEEALLHWSPENVRMCADRQGEILEEAAAMLRPGGTLVYSTCTFSPEENELTIAAFLDLHPEFSILPVSKLPGIREEDRDGWGFAPGRPEWAEKTGIEVREKGREASSDFSILRSLEGTVRLWPHLLEGEGHFAAVLRKAGGSGEAAERGPAGLSLRKTGGTGEAAERGPASLHLQEAAGSGEAAEGGPASLHLQKAADGVAGAYGAAKKDTRKKRRDKKAGGKKGRRVDPKTQELLRLWREFREETLSETGSGEPHEEAENLFCFGETLYALPVPADSLSLDGLRILRAGLQLGTSVKGRFVPSHSLGMALCPHEVQRVLNLSGQSDAAYAWLRGEALPLPEEAAGWKGWVLVTIDGCAAGWGKAAGAMLKNHYPKGLRKSSGYRP
ncbi:MAG: RsmB/NOP family class I SAM-dependent RNA methyltransferase, partial [Eubacteriales bacterium]|nr:RsmB/NOP family class I SAM-dependent RNA methyltransferase [Eubacteriales bacterium]